MSDNASSSSSSSSSSSNPLSDINDINDIDDIPIDERYKYGKVYKIFCSILGENDIYVGSTIKELEVRLNEHFTYAEINTSELHKFHRHMERLGLDNFHIMLIENYPCDHRMALRMREQYWMDKLKSRLNSRNAFTSVADYKTQRKLYYKANEEAIKAYDKLYKAENKVAIKAYQKLYRAENKEDLKAKSKLYIAENKEAIKAQRKLHRAENTDKNKAKADMRHKADRESGATHCVLCNKTSTTKSSFNQHKKSASHKARELADLLASEEEEASSTVV